MSEREPIGPSTISAGLTWRLDTSGHQRVTMLCAAVYLTEIDDGTNGMVFFDEAQVVFVTKHEQISHTMRLPVPYVAGRRYLVPIFAEKHPGRGTESAWWEFRIDGEIEPIGNG